MTNRPTFSLSPRGWESQRRKGEEFDDGNVSLTYSAASSVNSGGGETADSSFAEVMRVLDIQDSWELKEFIRKEGATSANRRLSSGQSLAGSLAYSTDGESHLEGSKLLQTLTG